MNLAERYLDNYVKFYDEAIYEEICNKLDIHGNENLLVPIQDVLKVEELELYSTLDQLECLYLEFNIIEDITPLCSLSNLKVLILDGNERLRDISPLSRMTNLELLSLVDINRNKSMKISVLRKALQEGGSNCKVIGSSRSGDNIYRATRIAFEESRN